MNVSSIVSGIGLLAVTLASLRLAWTESGQETLDGLALRQVPGHPSALREPVEGRILVLGDGSAFGVAVGREHAWPNLLRSEFGVDVQHRLGDGWEGWPKYGPYDGILVAAAVPVIILVHPITTEVTPCQEEGASSASQVACPS